MINQSALVFFIGNPIWLVVLTILKNLKVSWDDYSQYIRRKFRSQTSDNMDRWNAEMGRVREKRRVEERRAEERRSEKRKNQKKEDAGARKGRKVPKHCFFQWFVAPEGRKVGSLKRRVRSQLAKWETKKCTPLWRELHFQVKMYKTHQVRTTFGSWDVEKVHAAVARSTFRSQNSKCTKHTILGPLLEIEMSKKCTPLWRKDHFEVKMLRTPHVRATFGRSDVVSRGRRKGLCTLSKVKTWGFCSISRNDGRRGTFEENLRRCIFRGRRSTRDMFIRAVRMSGRWFPEKGCILEHQIFRFTEMILRERCSTLYDLASLFRGKRSSLDKWTGKNAKRIGTRPSTLHSTFHFWRTSRRIASFLLWTLKFKQEVSQKCFVFDVVKCKTWGSLAEFLRFWCCQVLKLSKSRRIASFSSLQIDRQTDR